MLANVQSGDVASAKVETNNVPDVKSVQFGQHFAETNEVLGRNVLLVADMNVPAVSYVVKFDTDALLKHEVAAYRALCGDSQMAAFLPTVVHIGQCITNLSTVDSSLVLSYEPDMARTLTDAIRDDTTTSSIVAQLFLACSRALRMLHKHAKWVHGDAHGHNFLVSQPRSTLLNHRGRRQRCSSSSGEVYRAKLIDFECSAPFSAYRTSTDYATMCQFDRTKLQTTVHSVAALGVPLCVVPLECACTRLGRVPRCHGHRMRCVAANVPSAFIEDTCVMVRMNDGTNIAVYDEKCPEIDLATRIDALRWPTELVKNVFTYWGPVCTRTVVHFCHCPMGACHVVGDARGDTIPTDVCSTSAQLQLVSRVQRSQ